MEMQTQELGTYGAKRVSWRSEAARNLLKAVLEENRDADEQFQLEEYGERVLKTPEAWKPLIEYFFANHRRSLLGRSRQSPPPRTKEKREEDVAAMMAKAAQRILFMEWVLPNGKRLAECTFGYLATLNGKLAKLAKKGKPNQIVGKVLSEKQVQALLR